jgi:hypothetical protein
MSLDNMLYLIPFDTEKLAEVKRHSDLKNMGECKEFAPFPNFFAEGAEWANDQNTLAVLMLANLGDGRRGNVIQIIDITECVPNPTKIKPSPIQYSRSRLGQILQLKDSVMMDCPILDEQRRPE